MKFFTFAIIISIVLLITGCNPGPGEKIAEYDGGYLWTTADRYVSVSEMKASTTQIANRDMNIMDLWSLPTYYYVTDSTPSATLSSGDIQGFYLKGDYNYSYFTLHPLVEVIVTGNKILFENKGSAKRAHPFYCPGEEKFDCDKKKDDNGYFFRLRAPLAPGKYVGWLNNSFWIFEVV